MSATDFLGSVTELVFLALAIVLVIRAVRTPRRSVIDMAAFFAIIAVILLIGDLADLMGGSLDTFATIIAFVGVTLLPYVMLRIVDDFAARPRWLMIGTLAITVVTAALGVVTGPDWPAAVQLLPIGLFVLLGGYTSVVLVIEARRARGITARRLAAAATGHGLVALVLLVAGIRLLLPDMDESVQILTSLLTLGAAVAYFIGFATPAILRRAWQQPELQTFLTSAGQVAHDPDEKKMLRELARLAAETVGSRDGVIGRMFQGDRLRYLRRDGSWFDTVLGELVGGIIAKQGRSLFTVDASRTDPAGAAMYAALGVQSVLGAPMHADGAVAGVLTIYAPQAPPFAEDDLRTVEIMADHIGSLLEVRGLLAQAAKMQAREEAARTKEDFLSAAAHDLRTPLSTLQLEVEMLQRMLARDGTPDQQTRVGRVGKATRRMIDFVSDLLDATRAEQGRLSKVAEPVDLVAAAEACVAEYPVGRHRITVTGSPSLTVQADSRRLRQVIDNLVGNAIKYSPDGGDIDIVIEPRDGMATLAVTDHGIGIAEEDLAHLFERFQRGRNVDDRRFSGLGLGLYICHRIVTEHDGAIEVTSEPGTGSTFRVSLPLEAAGVA